MADAVAGLGQPNPVIGRSTLNKEVVVKIFRSALQHIVVDVGHGPLGADAGRIHCLQFQIGHGPGRVLRQGLVYFQTDFIPGNHFSIHQMRRDDFFG